MCFGDTKTQSQDRNYTANPAVSGAATSALGLAQGLQGFKPYAGQGVAGFSPQQSSSFDIANSLATSGVPYTSQAAGAVGNAAGVGPQSVSANPIYSAMGPYMNAYVSQALAPQLAAQSNQFAGQNQDLNRAATSSGAFGDARAGIQAANLSLNQDLARQGLIGQAYTSAFNTAIGAGAQDVSNSLGAQTTNANLTNQYAAQQLAAAQGYQNLGGYQVGQGTNLANLQNVMGQQQTAQGQAGLNFNYQNYLLGMQYPLQALGAYNQTVNAGANAMPASSTTATYQPNNSGWALGGAVAGGLAGNAGFGSALGSALFLSDRDYKKDIAKVGELDDGQNVYRFRYRGDPSDRVQLGLMADEVEQVRPDAVVIPFKGGPKMVDYSKATGHIELGLAA